MSFPTFTKTGNPYSVFTFEKARFLPVNSPISPRQIIGISGGGQVQVANLGDPEQFFDVVVNRVSATNRNNLLGFLQHSTVNYSLNTFTFTDETGTTYTVRLWDSAGLDFPIVKGGLYNIKLTLRVEI